MIEKVTPFRDASEAGLRAELAAASSAVGRQKASATSMADRCRQLETTVEGLEAQLFAAEEGLRLVEQSFGHVEDLHEHLADRLAAAHVELNDTPTPVAHR